MILQIIFLKSAQRLDFCDFLTLIACSSASRACLESILRSAYAAELATPTFSSYINAAIVAPKIQIAGDNVLAPEVPCFYHEGQSYKAPLVPQAPLLRDNKQRRKISRALQQLYYSFV